MKMLVFRMSLVLTILSLVACADLVPKGSNAGTVKSVGASGSQGALMTAGGAGPAGNGSASDASRAPLLFAYDASIGFDKNIYPSVDLVFGRLRNADHDTQAIFQEFMEPGYQLLEQSYGLVLPRSALKADANAKTVSFDGAPGPASEVKASNRTIDLLGIGDKNKRFRLTSALDKASASFNSLHPRDVAIKALLSVRVEAYDPGNRSWQTVEPDERGKNRFAAALTKDLRNTYYRFLNLNYGVKITRSFKGSVNE